MAERFQLKMAKQEGERIAKEAGFDSFPICPRTIASKHNILIEAKPPDIAGVSGGIIFVNNQAIIFHATNIENEGFINFTISHELGHFFLPGHPEAIQEQGGTHVSKAGFTQGDSSIELEADHFAAGLLMPEHLVRTHINQNPPGLDSILELSSIAKCSVTAAAIRTAECSRDPIAIVVSSADTIAYAFMSESLKDFRPRFLRKGSALPNSATAQFNKAPNQALTATRKCAQTTFSDWFGGEHSFVMDEEILGLGQYGFTLTVLSSEEVPGLDDPDDEEEDNLEESWTPRFAYGR